MQPAVHAQYQHLGRMLPSECDFTKTFAPRQDGQIDLLSDVSSSPQSSSLALTDHQQSLNGGIEVQIATGPQSMLLLRSAERQQK